MRLMYWLQASILIGSGISFCLNLPALAQGSPYQVNGGANSPYKRTVGFGFSNPYHASINYPTFGVPNDKGNGFYGVPSGSTELPMWKAPSGYFYPWAPRPKSFAYAYPLPVLAIQNNGQSSTDLTSAASAAPAVPPLTVVIQDLENYLGKIKEGNNIGPNQVSSFGKRIEEIKSKDMNLRVAGSGNLNPGDEAQMRRELAHIGNELSAALTK